MSRLSGRLRSGGVRLSCGLLAEEDCLELEGPTGWGGDGGHAGATGGAPATASGASLHYSFFSSPSLANGLRSPEEQLHRRPRIGARRRRQSEQLGQLEQLEQSDFPLQLEQLEQLPQMCPEQQIQGQVGTDSSSLSDLPTVVPPQILTGSPHREAYPTSTQPHAPPYYPPNPSNPPQRNIDTHACPITAASPPTPAPIPNTILAPSPVPVPTEGERKYALRSSGRPRFPCRLRKSSRLRRPMEDEEKKEEREGEVQEEEKMWKGEALGLELGLGLGEESILPEGASMSGELRPMSRAPVLGKTVTSALEPVQPAPSPTSSRGRRKGRCIGIRKIVVKVARIPVSLSRRQKSYKISSMEAPPPLPGQEGGRGPGAEGCEGAGGGESGTAAPREPTALLKMKNNGKSVMVMFPPGELPVILKRRRGRPPKQVVPGQPDPREVRANATNTGEPKKQRRRRRVKLPSPQPSYVADTNDVKAEYGDVLSKLAFLNRQPPATGRCSPPRCWTPSEPESFHTPPENPGISTLLHRLTGFRRRGGRAGCTGARGGVAGSSEAFKSSFSDFFETIGKKRKVPPSEPGQPRKRGKGAAAGLSRAALLGADPGGLAPGEKPVRKRRSRKNGVLKSGQGQQDQDGANGGGNWGVKGGGREGLSDRERGLGYQGCSSPRGGFTSCDIGKGGFYPSPGVSGGGGDDAQGLFAGYFRSLLDSDDSSDLLDISLSSPASRPDSRKLGPGYESNSPAPSQRWSPAFPKRTTKGPSPASDGPLQPQCSTPGRPPYSYSLSQTSPTTSFPKSAPPTLSLSRSPSSPHPSSSSFPQYPAGYSSGQSTGGGSTTPQQQRLSDCSYSYGVGLGSGKATSVSPAGQCHMGFSSFQTAQAKRGYSGYAGSAHSAAMRGEPGLLAGPASPGGSYMAMAKSPFPSSSPPESCRQYPSSQWGYRPGYQSWGNDNFGPHQYHGYNDYGTSGSHESKDILDISNYTPQKVKQRSFSETFSESSSDSSHLGPAGAGMGGGGSGGYRPRDLPSGEGQSSLSSLEKLMLDWHESSAGSSYNWSQNVLFQGGSKPGRGRRKRAEPQGEREGCPLSFPPGSPSSSPSPVPGSKRSPMAARQSRGSRGRGGFSSCQRERAPPGKPKAQKTPASVAQAGGAGLYQDTLDYYSGDSSSLSPLPSQQQGYSMEVCEYSSPYSVHPSTPSSDERFAQIFPGETASLSPSISLQPDVLKPYPKPAHPPAFSVPSRTFSPSCSPTPRLLPSCGAANSPHRAPNKDFSQYDSPSYCGSPCWYGQGGSLAGSPHSYEAERPPVSAVPPHARTEKRDLSQVGGAGLRSAPPTPSPYPTPLHRGSSSSSSCATVGLDSPLPEDLGFSLHPESYPTMPQRYAPQPPRGGVLCQLLDQPAEDGFTVTSL
ncbi:transcription factor Gibbin [Conger conger]|nr:transcription factor Gibbin [Conger conger]